MRARRPPPPPGLPFETEGVQYTIERRDQRVFHKATRRDAAGSVLAEIEAEVRFALGSGKRGTNFLIERDGFLFQSPIAWFAEKARWGISPGYGDPPPPPALRANDPDRVPVLPYQPVARRARDIEPLRAADLRGPRHRLRALPRPRRAAREAGWAVGRARLDHRQPGQFSPRAAGLGLSAMPSPGLVPLPPGGP